MILALLAACTESTPTGPTADPLDGGWVGVVVREPAKWEATVGAEREGWIALHKNDWLAAVAAGGAPASRAAAELAVMNRVLDGLSRQAWARLAQTWSDRGGLPEESALPLFAKLAGAPSTVGMEAVRLPPAFGSVDGEPVAWMLAHAEAEVWKREAAVRGGDRGDLAGLRRAAAEAAWQEGIPGGERRLYDPLVHDTLATAYGLAGTPVPELAGRLFSDHLGAEGLPLREELGALGVPLPAEADSPEACRATLQALDAKLDPWGQALAGAASVEGKALLQDLQLVAGLRARVLTTLAVQELDRQHPGCASILARNAIDAGDAREIGPLNPPTAFAVLAAAELQGGHVREALDALQPLASPFPETTGVREVTGDLAVLLGMNRIGDSREN
jgi:hypothetical protein